MVPGLQQIALLAVVSLCSGTFAADSDGVPLSESQSRLSDRYNRLELLAGRLAELSSSTQPRRAKLLREFVSKSRGGDIAGRFEKAVLALEGGSLARAVKQQGELQLELEQLLELLLQEDRDSQIESERKRVAKYLAELKKLIRMQSGIRARTEGNDDAQELSEDQQRAADATAKLARQIDETEGSDREGKSSDKNASADPKSAGAESESKDGEPESDGKDSQGQSGEQDSKNQQDPQQGGQPSEGKPGETQESSGSENSPSESESGEPSESSQGSQGESGESGESSSSESEASESEPEKPADRAAERLKQARERMERAIEKLQESQNNEAIEVQEEALRELEQAKAELEKILRQLREEEMERKLVLLEARIRQMLDAQNVVYEQTKQIHESADQVAAHELTIAAARLSRKERQIVREADKALVLLREDGTSVAFPEALEQVRADMETVADRLNDTKVAAVTQALEEDIIASLEETLAAFQQALKELREKKSQPQQPSQQGSPGEQPLVDQLAELRMIRSLQNRINRRTTLYGNMIEGEQAVEPDLLEALEELAERENRVYKATLDLHHGANQ